MREPNEYVITVPPVLSGLHDGLYVSDDGHLVQLLAQVCTRCRADIQMEVWNILSEHTGGKRATAEAIIKMIDATFPNAMQDYRVKARYAT